MTVSPLHPGSTIGILGGGQLGRMLAMAAAEIGFRSHIFCDADGQPASQVATRMTIAPYDDKSALKAFAADIDIATFEFENIPAEALEFISTHTRLAPNANALKATRDRLVEKNFIAGLGVPVAPFIDIVPGKPADLKEISSKIKFPALLKTRRFGYDGKGQIKLDALDEVPAALDRLNARPAIIEEMIPFERELSIIGVRDREGTIHFYDLTENNHDGGILHTSKVPANADPEAGQQAEEIARKIAEALDYVGTFAIEYFYSGENEKLMLIVNEIAPRVHNTGHWTMDAAVTSQFENHVRAIANWPLAATTRTANALMTNLIGDDLNRWPELAKDPANALHIYGKTDIRPGRKMAHVTHISPKIAE